MSRLETSASGPSDQKSGAQLVSRSALEPESKSVGQGSQACEHSRLVPDAPGQTRLTEHVDVEGAVSQRREPGPIAQEGSARAHLVGAVGQGLCHSAANDRGIAGTRARIPGGDLLRTKAPLCCGFLDDPARRSRHDKAAVPLLPDPLREVHDAGMNTRRVTMGRQRLPSHFAKFGGRQPRVGPDLEFGGGALLEGMCRVSPGHGCGDVVRRGAGCQGHPLSLRRPRELEARLFTEEPLLHRVVEDHGSDVVAPQCSVCIEDDRPFVTFRHQ